MLYRLFLSLLLYPFVRYGRGHAEKRPVEPDFSEDRYAAPTPVDSAESRMLIAYCERLIDQAKDDLKDHLLG